jgi:uncharacterized protein YjbJ (UPF0337 family)
VTVPLGRLFTDSFKSAETNRELAGYNMRLRLAVSAFDGRHEICFPRLGSHHFANLHDKENRVMVNRQALAGHWNEIRGKLKEKWGKLTDDDLRTFNGNVEQLIGRIQQKTGETREAIEEFLGELGEEGSNFLEAARERVQAAAGQARDKMQDTVEDVTDEMRQGYDNFRQGYAEAERVVQERPGQAVALAFGVGLLVGVGATLFLRNQNREVSSSRACTATEQFGRRVLDALAGVLPESLAKHTRT